MLIRHISFCTLLASLLLCSSTICSSTECNAGFALFCPPKKWEIVDARALSPRVTVGFVKKLGSGFSPSINLATEKIRCTEMEYLKTVRSLYEADRETRWRDVGTIHTKAGDARLTEIDMKSKWGPVRMMQMLFIRGDTVYILTAAAPKKQFSKYTDDFHQCFTSFSLEDDLLKMMQTEEELSLITNKINCLKETKGKLSLEKNADSSLWQKECSATEKFLSESFPHHGAYWQMLMMKHIIEQASSPSEGKDA